jgi:hypothetical protein
MFFHTHVYYAKRVDKNLDALKVVGSMFPDFALTGLITWDDLHKKKGILNFFGYVEESAPQFQSFLKGINYHNTLDYFSHLEYKNSTPGYAYASVTPELFNLVKKSLGTEDARTRASCHNLIESGVDYHLLNENPDIAMLIKDSINEIDTQSLAKIIAGFYKRKETEIMAGFKNLFSFATDYDLRNIDEWIRLWVDLNKFYLKIDTDEKFIRQALELSFELTKDTWREYLETSIASKDTEIKDCN